MRDKQLPEHGFFITALASDNKYLDKAYIKQLENADKITRERLLYGNFDYEDDLSKLFEYDKILDMFTNHKLDINEPKKYLTVDVARYGNDSTVLILWEHLRIIRMQILKGKSLKEVRLFIEQVMANDNVPRSNVIIDEDGIGGGLVDELTGVKGFVNNSKPKETDISKKNT